MILLHGRSQSSQLMSLKIGPLLLVDRCLIGSLCPVPVGVGQIVPKAEDQHVNLVQALRLPRRLPLGMMLKKRMATNARRLCQRQWPAAFSASPPTGAACIRGRGWSALAG